MTGVSWLCLCLDVQEPALGEFWAAASGGRLVRGTSPGDPGHVEGPPGGNIELCPVAEPKTVKHRVHLDVHTDSVDSLVTLGATVLRPADESQHWTVLADPEGGELCAFVRDQPPDYRIYEVVVDSAEPEQIARWWADRFGVSAGHEEPHPWWWVADVPGMPFDSIVFDTVLEPKTVKNRIHWDVYGDVAELEAAGATVLQELPRWTTMADPEGNEFCVFPHGGSGLVD